MDRPFQARPAADRLAADQPAADRLATDRYARHRAIAGFSQDALAASRIAVVGAGAIGNEVVKNLALLGVGRIDLIDLDRVELHNLTRSVLLRPDDVGRPKAECVARRAAELDPAVRIEAIVGDVRDVLAVSRVRACTAVIAALDNFEARIRVNQLCWLAGTAWINAAIDSRHATVESFPFHGGADCACYECGLPASVYGRIAERQSCGGLQRAALAERVMPTTIVTAALAAARAVDLALRFAMPPQTGVPGAADDPAALRWLIDSRSGLASTVRIARNPACPGCADLPRGARLVSVPAAAEAVVAAARAHDAGTLRLADPLVWRLACRRCGPTPATRAAELRPAREVSDRVMRCARCGEDTVAVEIRDLVDLDDFAARYREAAADGDGSPPAVAARLAVAGDVVLDIAAEPHMPSDPPHGLPSAAVRSSRPRPPEIARWMNAS